MADFTPVGNQFQPPDPLKGVNTFSAILGIKQRQQALQTGQYLQQSAQANAATAQRDNAQNQALSQVDWKQFQNEDGSWDTDKIGKTAISVAPNTGSEFAQRFNTMMEGSAKTKAAFHGLSNDYQNEVRSTLGAWASDPKAPKEDLVAALNNQVDNADKASKDHLYQVAKHTLHMIDSPNPAGGTPRSLDQQKQLAVGFSRAGLGAESQSGPSGLATPAVGMQNVGGAILPTAQSRTTGANTVASGGLKVGLAPTDQPAYRAAVARATTGAGGAAGIDVDRANNVSNNAQQVQGQIALTKQADQLTDMIKSGNVSKAIADAYKKVGVNDPAVAARMELRKVLGQLKSGAAESAKSDAHLSTAMEAYPDETAPNEVLHARMDFMRGAYRLAQERKDNLNAYQAKHPDLGGFQRADDAITSARDPLSAELKTLPPGSAERRAFLARNFKTKDAAQEAIHKARAAYHSTPDQP